MSTSTIQEQFISFFKKLEESSIPLDKVIVMVGLAQNNLQSMEILYTLFNEEVKDKKPDDDRDTVITKDTSGTKTGRKNRKLFKDETSLFCMIDKEVLFRLNYKGCEYFIVNPITKKIYSSSPEFNKIKQFSNWNSFIANRNITFGKTTNIHNNIEYKNNSNDWVSLKTYSLDGKTKLLDV